MPRSIDAVRRSARMVGLCLAAVFPGIGSSALAYDLPSLNLGNTSFFDGALPPTGPGLYGVQYLTLYRANRLADANGHRLALPDQKLRLLATTTELIYVAPAKLFGMAHPGATILLPVVAAARVEDGLGGAVLRAGSGVGDALFGAFLAFDPIVGPDGPRLSQALEVDVIAPTGDYSRTLAINPGSNFLSLDPFYAATFWVTPALTLSGRFHYLWNAVNDLPNIALGPAVRSSQAGQAFHMNLAMHYRFDDRWGAGLNGYYLQQLSNTRINGEAVPGRRERVFAVGPGLTIALSRDHSIFFNTYQEFGARNRPQGTRLVARFNAHF